MAAISLGVPCASMRPCSSTQTRSARLNTTRWPTFRIASLGVGYVPEGRRIFANLSVEENLKVPLEREGPWNIERIFKLFPRLEERKQNRGRAVVYNDRFELGLAGLSFCRGIGIEQTLEEALYMNIAFATLSRIEIKFQIRIT